MHCGNKHVAKDCTYQKPYDSIGHQLLVGDLLPGCKQGRHCNCCNQTLCARTRSPYQSRTLPISSHNFSYSHSAKNAVRRQKRFSAKCPGKTSHGASTFPILLCEIGSIQCRVGDLMLFPRPALTGEAAMALRRLLQNVDRNWRSLGTPVSMLWEAPIRGSPELVSCSYSHEPLRLGCSLWQGYRTIHNSFLLRGEDSKSAEESTET
jgi:hypothetical protein